MSHFHYGVVEIPVIPGLVRPHLCDELLRDEDVARNLAR